MVHGSTVHYLVCNAPSPLQRIRSRDYLLPSVVKAVVTSSSDSGSVSLRASFSTWRDILKSNFYNDTNFITTVFRIDFYRRIRVYTKLPQLQLWGYFNGNFLFGCRSRYINTPKTDKNGDFYFITRV